MTGASSGGYARGVASGTMESPVGRALLRLTGISLLAVALVGLVDPRRVSVDYRWQVVVPTVGVGVVLAALGRVPHTLKRRWVPGVVAVAGAAAATFVAMQARYSYGWDAGAIMSMARSLHAGRPLSQHDLAYLSLFPNNLPLLAIDRVGADVAQALGLAPDAVLIALAGAGLAVTLYAVHVLVGRVAGPGPALVAQLVVVVLVGLSPWLSVPYTDVLAMPFVAGGAALASRALTPGRRGVRLILCALAIVALAVAYVVKTTPVVVVVAVAITAVVAVFERERVRRRALSYAGAGLAALLMFVGLAVGLQASSPVLGGVDHENLRPNGAPTLLWWVANGSAKTVSGSGLVSYGAYVSGMVDAIDGRTPEQMNDYARGYLADRWQERGLAGTAVFYADKLAWNWGDGMFSAWGEGGDSLPGRLAPATGLTGVVHDLNGFNGVGYRVRAELTQGLWLAVLLVAGVGLLRAPYRREVLLLALSVLGIAAFTMVFQGRSRYLFAFVPLVVALAGTVHPSFRGVAGWPRRGRATGGHRRRLRT